jgi:hypothetical protein
MNKLLILMIFLVLSNCSKDANATHAKFHYNQRVKFTDDFYGECKGKVHSYDCSYPYIYSYVCTYSVSSTCEFQDSIIMVFNIPEECLTETK